MSQHTIHNIIIETLSEAKKEIQKIGSDPKSIDIMAPKAVFRTIKIDNVFLQDAIIIKQDMLSLGGEVAIPKHAFELQNTPATILIMGTLTQLRGLVDKLTRHYSRIQNLAQELSETLNAIESPKRD